MLAVSQTNADALLAQLQALYGSDHEQTATDEQTQRATRRGASATTSLSAELMQRSHLESAASLLQ